MSADASSPISACRTCGATELRPVLDLGATPLANRLLEPGQARVDEPRFPLAVVFCPACTLVQLTETVSPEVLFRDYVYFSSFSQALLDHSRRHADELIASRHLGPGRRVVEVASNDGYLLQFFRSCGVSVLGIEPARNVARVARERGVDTLDEFFGLPLAERLRAEGTRADVVLANNVLAHVADLNGFVAGIERLLADDGIAELEFPYVADLIDGLEFDTIYHEHLCYFSAHAVDALFGRHGLVVTDVQRLAIHGGSLRVTVARATASAGRARVEALLADERVRGLDRPDFYTDFGGRVRQLGEELVTLLRRLKGEGKRLVAYGASAKGATLLNTLGIGRDLLDYVVDRSTVKQGKLTPGAHLPIEHPRRLLEDRPDLALLLTWNFAEEILGQQAEYRAAGGRFILPLPELRIV